MDISIVELESMPQDEFRALNIPDEAIHRIVKLANPSAIEIKSEVVGDYVRITVTDRATQFLDLQTGRML